jgi:23S rRNA (uracil1939-C5)-methyltransferase
MIEGTGVIPIVSNFEVTVEKLVYGGEGLGRVDGRVVLAPFVLPGERIRAQIEREKPGLAWARALEVLQAAPERVHPLCPYFGQCGGCHYQHALYELQLAAKLEILRDQLRRVGKFDPPGEISVVSAEPWGYRNRAQLHIESGRLGYWEARSHKLCAIDHCPVSSPKLNDAIAAIRGMLRDSRWPRFLRGIELFTDEEQVQLNVIESAQPVARRFFDWCAEQIPGLVPGPLDYQGQYRVSGQSFFQANRFLLQKLVETALQQDEGESALELYAGVGLFSPALGGRFRDVTAVESGSAAVRDLQFNLERAGRANVTARKAMAEEHLAALERAPDLVLLDPPRAGLGKTVVKRLAELRPSRLTIVSCDPATLARDLAGLAAAGYQIATMTLIDLFPQTYHLETVVRLRL